jgi:hypothetical protein
MFRPFPLDDDPRGAAAQGLREAQRLLHTGEVRASILETRRALDWIEGACGWQWPGQKKEKTQRLQDERWAWIRSALHDQASGALHADAVTRNFDYSAAEAETLISMTAALLRIVP